MPNPQNHHHALVEGFYTEKAILKTLASKLAIGFSPEVNEPPPHRGGKSTIKVRLERLLPQFLQPAFPPSRILVMRDVDTNEGESINALKNEYEGVLTQMSQQAGNISPIQLQSLTGHSNVFTFALARPDFRIAFHFADEQRHGFTGFVKQTTDDYMLRLLECQNSVNGIFQRICTRPRTPSLAWAPGTDATVVRQIESQIRQHVGDVRLPSYLEAKYYLTVYAMIVREYGEDKFIEWLIDGADTSDVRDTFSSLIAAIDFLTR
jgi:hypothetical protein